ncbi:hypothetical protein GTA08_BOTSDO04208 [Botryosphaeria dothidea]|uniref:BHLH domain-containing protein n=1 Tax=Botryosphaeria dothidea TaxID=55169 RepID=A0A8H4NAW6_9PEZI|nr:hypothetical protein GTA08_BOTSDO04208 [Botryosphaeria dothidea]
MFHRLRNTIPSLNGGGGTGSFEECSLDGASKTPGRLTKAVIITRAIEHINEMEAENQRMRVRYKSAVEENERLKQTVVELEVRLSL